MIERRAGLAVLSDVAYFRKIVAGRAPRVSGAEDAREPLPGPTGRIAARAAAR